MDETFGELGRVFRSVGKLVREKTEDYFGNVSPVDRALREVTDEGCCTIPNSLLRELAKASNDIHSYHPIMQCIWQGLAQEGAAWRRTYKSLCLLEYVILFGPPRAIDDCRHAMMRIKYLSGFRYHDGTREQGGGVRQKSHYIMELIDQPETLAAARQKALQDSERYVGIENRPVFDTQGLGAMHALGNLNPGFPPPTHDTDRSQASLPPAAQSWSPFFTGPTRGSFGQPPANPFATINSFQSEADARHTWNVHTSPDLGADSTNFARGYDAPPIRSSSLQGESSQQSTANSASYERGASLQSSQRLGKVKQPKAAKTAVNLLSVDDDASMSRGEASDKTLFDPNVNELWTDTSTHPLPQQVDPDDDFFNAQTDIFSSTISPDKVSKPVPSSSDLLSFEEDAAEQSSTSKHLPSQAQTTKPQGLLNDLVGL